MQILVVEDSPVYRQLLTSYLQEWGFPFKITKDGSEVPRLPGASAALGCIPPSEIWQEKSLAGLGFKLDSG